MLLDGHSLAFRAFYALPAENFKTHSGQATNAVYGFTSMLINLLRDEQPTHLAAAFDVSRQTFRADLFPEYKAQRAKAPDEFKGQIDITKDVLGALGIPVMAEEGFEADDVIAHVDHAGGGTRIPGSRRDRRPRLAAAGDRQRHCALPEEGCLGAHPIHADGPSRRSTASLRRSIRIFAALRGDPSDNLPGIPGVGEKTATKWIREYGDLQGLVDNVDKVRGKVGDSLRENIANVLLNRQLTEMVRDVPLPYTPEQLVLAPWDREKIHALFDDLEFKVLRDRLFATLSSSEPEAEEGFEVSGDALAPGAVTAWLDAHARTGERHGVTVLGTRTPFCRRRHCTRDRGLRR